MLSSTIGEEIGANVRAELARARVTQTTLAKHLNLSQQSVSSKLAGRTPFTADQLVAVAELLRVSPAGLLPEVASR